MDFLFLRQGFITGEEVEQCVAKDVEPTLRQTLFFLENFFFQPTQEGGHQFLKILDLREVLIAILRCKGKGSLYFFYKLFQGFHKRSHQNILIIHPIISDRKRQFCYQIILLSARK